MSLMNLNDDLDRIALQESELVLPRFDTDIAWELGRTIRGLANKRGFAVVVDVRRFGQQLFYAALDGTTPDNAEWVRRKNNVVARFHRSSYAVGLKAQLKGENIYEAQGLSLADYCTHGGAFPLAVENVGIVGSATVSGLPQRDDHELVVEALCILLGRDFAALRLAAEVSS
jgi:uncharacterized protein (UPF0303 family)